MSKALVLLSGGQDSTTALYMAKQAHDEVHAIAIDYQQRHRRELQAARVVANMAGVATFSVLWVPEVLKSGSPLVNVETSLGHYKDVAALPGGLEETFVPMRNALFLTIAANRAIYHGCEFIYIGVCAADDEGYPDCRPMFIQQLQNAFNLGVDPSQQVRIVTPLMHMSKAQTVRAAASIPGCMEALAFSHTCYEGQFPPCGTCHACLLRAKGFTDAGHYDPLAVRAAVGP